MARANGWKVLCIDGGGTRGIVPLTVLQSLKTFTGKEPWQIFDVMVGTSTGGILAVLLGLLKLPVEDCIGLYEKLGKEVFEPGFFGKSGHLWRLFSMGQRYPVQDLERVIKEILAKHCDGKADIKLDELGQEDGGRPYVILVANRDGSDGGPYRFANFWSNDDEGNTLTNRVHVWEAIRATSAAPTYFEPIRIDVPGVGKGVQFYDGGIKYNNPIEVARTLMERHPFDGTDPSLFVSLGTGMNIFKLGGVDSLKGTLNTLVKAATASEHVHRNAYEQLKVRTPYFRFNPSHGVGDLPMDSMAFVEQMRNATQEYLTIPETRTKMMDLVKAVKNEAPKPAINMLPYMRPDLVRREDKINEIKAALLNDDPGKVVLVWGMGGAGKTTLARQVVEDPDVQGHFCDGLLWVTLGAEATEATVVSAQNQMCRKLGLKEVMKTDEGTDRLKEAMEGKTCLLVVDDVWATKHLEALDVIGTKGALLYTSRSDDAITRGDARADIHVSALEPRGDIACDMLRSSARMKPQEELPQAAWYLLDICAGLPLAIVIVGSLRGVLRGRAPQWEDILKNMETTRSEQLKFRSKDKGSFGYQHPGLADAIQVSLRSLEMSPDEDDKAAYEAIWYYGAWVEDEWVTEEGAGRVWGLDNMDTINVLQALVGRSLIELDTQNYSKAHDLMRDFLRSKAHQEGRLVKLHAEITRRSLRDPKVLDDYKWESPYSDKTVKASSHTLQALSDCALSSGLVEIRLFSIGNNEGAKALAEVLPQCQALQTLDLLGNKIRDEGAKALAKAFSQCQALQILDVQWNGIGNEGAKALAEALPKCQALQCLDLGLNEIGDEGAKALAMALPQCQALQTLKLRDNGIWDEGAKALAAALPQCQALQTLDLSHNEIGDEGAKALAAALPQCQALQTLNLGLNEIGDEGAKALATALPQCQALLTLNLANNKMGAEGAKALAEALPQCQALQTLTLYTTEIGAEGATALAEALPQCQALQELDLSGNEIGDEGAKALAMALPQCQALQTLNLSANKMGAEGAKALAEALPQCQALQTLNLYRNKIGAEGAKGLAMALPQCQALQILNVHWNSFGNEGARALAEALPQCQALQCLGLSLNEIRDEGAKALAEALPQCQALQTLDLSEQTLDLSANTIGDEGVKALAEALPQCQALQTLNLYRNMIGDEGAKALAAALPQCQALQTLTLYTNEISDEGAKALAAALPQCQALQSLDLSDNRRIRRIGVEAMNALEAAYPGRLIL